MSTCRHFEALAHRKDGSFALVGSSLTGNTWDGSLWYFNNWDHFSSTHNLDLDSISTPTGHSDIEWFNDSQLIVASDSGDLGVWQVIAPGNVLQCHAHLEGMHNDMVLTVRVTGQEKDGYVISGGGDGHVVVWDLATTKSIHKYNGHIGWVTDIGSHPTEPNVFISTSIDRQVKVWDCRQSSPVTMSISAPSGVPCHSVAWSIQDDVLVLGDESGYLYVHDLRDFSEHSPPCSFHVHSLSINRLSFSRCVGGDLVATVSDDMTSKLFSLSTSSIVCSNKFHSDFVRGLSWEPNSTPSSCSYLTCSWDGHVIENSFNGEIPRPSIAAQEASITSECWDDQPDDRMEEGKEKQKGERNDSGSNGCSLPEKQVAMETVRSNGIHSGPSRFQSSD